LRSAWQCQQATNEWTNSLHHPDNHRAVAAVLLTTQARCVHAITEPVLCWFDPGWSADYVRRMPDFLITHKQLNPHSSRSLGARPPGSQADARSRAIDAVTDARGSLWPLHARCTSCTAKSLLFNEFIGQLNAKQSCKVAGRARQPPLCGV
jgi:hypothetical protein